MIFIVTNLCNLVIKKRNYHQKIFVLDSKENLPNFPNWGRGGGGWNCLILMDFLMRGSLLPRISWLDKFSINCQWDACQLMLHHKIEKTNLAWKSISHSRSKMTCTPNFATMVWFYINLHQIVKVQKTLKMISSWPTMMMSHTHCLLVIVWS